MLISDILRQRRKINKTLSFGLSEEKLLKLDAGEGVEVSYRGIKFLLRRQND